MKFRFSLLFSIFSVIAFPVFVEGKELRVSFQYSFPDGIAKLGWEGTNIYGLECSTNLSEWSEVKRFTGNAENRIDLEINAPNLNSSFYRVREFNVLDVGVGRERDIVHLKDVNDAGRVVGFFQSIAPRDPPPDQGFTWAPGEPFTNFGNDTAAVAVNQQGVVLGYTNVALNGFTKITYLFTWTPGAGIVVLEEGSPVDINDSGHVLALETRLPRRTFLWKPGVGKIQLPHLDPRDQATGAIALSNAGHVIGQSLVNGESRAFFWTEAAGIVDITKSQSHAVDVNEKGEVIGHRVLSDGSVRYFLWSSDAGLVNLPNSVTTVADVNNNGQIAGSFIKDFQNHGFLWTRTGGIVDLGVLTPGGSGWAASNAVRVNDKGQVVGDSIVPPGFSGPFFWSATSGIVPLDILSLNNAAAVLINNTGHVFGYVMGAGGTMPHILMWDGNKVPVPVAVNGD